MGPDVIDVRLRRRRPSALLRERRGGERGA